MFKRSKKQMKKIGFVCMALFSFSQLVGQTAIFNDLLQKHVTKEGEVDYKNFNSQKLKKYTAYLEKSTPKKYWSVQKQKAFWINAYNAYTINLILDARQSRKLKNSIKNIKRKGKSAWEIPFAKVGGKTYTLNYIEHEILRKNLFDPRIHVGVNCASSSCPKMSNEAFTEDNIDSKLEILMKNFVNDTLKNKISNKKIQLSSIFDWFQEDFKKNGTVIGYLNRYSIIKISSNATISYLKYNWTLNEK